MEEYIRYLELKSSLTNITEMDLQPEGKILGELEQNVKRLTKVYDSNKDHEEIEVQHNSENINIIKEEEVDKEVKNENKIKQLKYIEDKKP